MKIYFWLTELSMHFSAVIRAIGDMGHDVTVVAQQQLKLQRRELGWFVPDYGAAKVVVAPTDAQIDAIVRQSDPAAVHITDGLRGELESAMLRVCRRYRRRAGIHVESPHLDGMSLLKWMVYVFRRVTAGRGVDFVLPLGRIGEKWYRRCGFAGHRVFPVMYVPDYVAPPVTPDNTPVNSSELHMIYLGRLIPIKRVDFLLNGLSRQTLANWRCTIVGDGSMKPDLQKLALHLGVADHVDFLPSMPHADAMVLLRKHDLLLLTSKHEGWGVVVNEALMNGIPVICGDRCAAANLVGEEWRGGVFLNDDLDSFAQMLDKWIRRGPPDLVLRRQIQQWSQRLSGEHIGRYIIDVLKCVYDGGPVPTPPWISQPSQRKDGCQL